MRVVPQSSRRPTAPRVVLAALSVVALMALTQCKMTADKVTGVEMGASKAQPQNRGSCISDCAHQTNDARKQENDLHKANEDACNGDPTCLANEEARHEAALDAIDEERQHCIDGCHHQGGGNAR